MPSRTYPLALLGLIGCAGPATTPAQPTPVPADARHTHKPQPATSPLDDLFRGYVEMLPEPESLSEANGSSVECAPRRYETYTHLQGLARRLPLESDADLVALVPWAHAADPCIRDLAIEAIVGRIQFDRNQLSAPGMHTPDDHLFHQIMRALRTYLVTHSVSVPPALFAGMFLEVTASDLAVFRGAWVENVGTSKNFQLLVELDAKELRVTTHTVQPDPKWPDRTETLPLTSLTVDARGAFVITGPNDAFAILPVGRDVVWIAGGNAYWNQLRRK